MRTPTPGPSTWSLLAVGIVLAALAGRAGAAELELRLIRIFDGPRTDYVFAVNEVGFRSVSGLKRFVVHQERGTVLRWAPGCERTGDEPLLARPRRLDTFRRFCRRHGVELVVVPAG